MSVMRRVRGGFAIALPLAYLAAALFSSQTARGIAGDGFAYAITGARVIAAPGRASIPASWSFGEA